MFLRTCSNSKPTVDTAYPRAQKCSPVKFRSLPHKRAIAMALFPFRNPITEATGYFGGIAMHMCTWSGSRCPSMIWHSFCRANRSEEHTSELQSRQYLVCRLLLEKKKNTALAALGAVRGGPAAQ